MLAMESRSTRISMNARSNLSWQVSDAWASFSAAVSALLGLREPARADVTELTQPLTQGVTR